MTTFLDNKASLVQNGRSIHFRDTSWRKNDKWKIYLGYACDDLKLMHKVCLKVPVNSELDEEECDEEIDKYTKLQELANAFSNEFSPKSKIKVLIPEKATLDRRAGVHMWKGRKRSLSKEEWFLVYKKIGNALDVFVKRDGGRPRNKSCEILEAFVHFVYHTSERTWAVSKLRGTRQNNCYILSCPSLIKTDNKVKQVMKNHICNSICHEFLKPESQPSFPLAINSVVAHRTEPSAPPQEESESDDEVFERCSKGSFPQIDNRNLRYIMPNERPWNDTLWFTPFEDLPGNDQWNIPNGQCFQELPPYSSQCPDGHRVAAWCGRYDANANLNKNNMNPRFLNLQLLDVGDTASVQQQSMNSEGF